jgi:NAD+ synthase
MKGWMKLGKSVKEKIDLTVEWLREQVEQAGAKGLAVGISGGVDSALTAFLIKRAFPQNSLGIIMPCESDPKDIEDALKVAAASQIEFIRIDLTEIYATLMKNIFSQLEDHKIGNKKIAMANTKARLRMSTIYAICNYLNFLVVGTDNAAEIYTGYFTKYGDGGVDIMPLANLTKREVRAWAREIGVPEEIILKAPSAGLWPNQTDEGEMGTTYDIIDDFLEGNKVPAKDFEIIEKLHRRSEHKRKLPSSPPKY